MRFAFPSALRGAAAALTSSGAVDPQYPLASLHSGNPIDPTRWTTDAEVRLVWDFGAPVTLEGLLIVRHTVAAGATLKVQAHTSDSWGAPTFSHDVVVPAWLDHLSPNILADFRGTALEETGFRFVSLLIPAQAADHGIGELLWVSAWTEVELGGTSDRVLRRSDVRRIHVNSTAYGVDHVIERRVRQRRLAPRFEGIDEADRAQLVALAREAGADRGFPVVIEVPGPSGTLTLEELFVRFHPESIANLTEAFLLHNAQEIQLDLLEVQPGRPL